MDELEVKYIGKVVVVGYNPEIIKGSHVSVLAGGKEIKTADRNEKNEVDIYFPLDETEPVEVTVKGSKSGSQSSVLAIEQFPDE